MLAGVFLCGCQEQEVNQVSDKYLQGYILMLDNWKMTTLYVSGCGEAGRSGPEEGGPGVRGRPGS